MTKSLYAKFLEKEVLFRPSSDDIRADDKLRKETGMVLPPGCSYKWKKEGFDKVLANPNIELGKWLLQQMELNCKPDLLQKQHMDYYGLTEKELAFYKKNKITPEMLTI